MLDFFGLREQPFGVTPDPRYLYFSPSHREAFASLIYAIQAKRGFSALIAEPGMGKTSLLFHLLEKLQNSTRTAFLFQPEPDQQGLLRSLLVDLGINVGLKSVSHMHEALNQILLQESQTGRHFVLVIDEAQDLEDSVLESVRLLSNFETPHAKLMHIVLAGQPTLANRLVKPELGQLRQRIAAWAGLHTVYGGGMLRIYRSSTQSGRVSGRKPLPSCSETTYRVGKPGASEEHKQHMFCLPLAWICNTAKSGERRNRTGSATGPETSAARANGCATVPRPMPAFHYLPPLPETRTERRSRGIGGAIIGLILIPLLLIFLAGELRIDFLRSKASAVRDNVFQRITGPRPRVDDTLPILPLPTPPTIDLFPANRAEEQDAARSSPPAQAEHRPRLTAAKMPSHSRTEQTPRHSSRIVVVHKQETLFQLAMEQYGKSNWSIVRKIREHNPDITDPYVYVDEGQRIVLPDLAPQFPWKTERNIGVHSRP